MLGSWDVASTLAITEIFELHKENWNFSTGLVYEEENLICALN